MRRVDEARERSASYSLGSAPGVLAWSAFQACRTFPLQEDISAANTFPARLTPFRTMAPVLPRAQRARGSDVRASKAPRRSQYKSLLASPSCVSLSEEPSVLFVCLGNVCRSPTAEAVLKRKLEKHSLSRSVFVDYCSLGGGSRSWWWHEGGVSYHEGDPADARMRSVASKRKIHLTSTSRPLTKHDLHFFHKILCADDLNLQVCLPFLSITTFASSRRNPQLLLLCRS